MRLTLVIFGGKTFVKVMFRYKKKPLKILMVFFILTGLFILSLIFILPGKLSETTKVDANILVVEGWLPPYALEMAYKEYRQNDYDYIVTTGLRSEGRHLLMAENGYMIFYPQKYLPISDKVPVMHLFEVKCYSDLEGEYGAHFNIFINDSLIADFYAVKAEKSYSAKWYGPLSEIDSVTIQFDNDRGGSFGDINLNVKEIIIDRKMSFPAQLYSDYDIAPLDGKNRTINDFRSVAEMARNMLISMGIDSLSVISITGENTMINRTLTSALAFRDFADTSDLEIRGINIVSLGSHAGRTIMVYDKVLKRKYDIGIISVPDSQ